MGLEVRVSARPEHLRDALLAWLAADDGDPLAPQVVVVPNAGVRAWFGTAVALRDGVVAGVEFLFPADLRRRLLGLPGPGEDPWRPERLAWTVLAAVADPDGPPAPWGDRADRPWSLARRVADVLDAAGARRPDLVAAWAAGAPGGWQADLWRDLRRRIGTPAPGEVVAAALRGDPPEGDVDLPDRIAVLGLSGLSVPDATLLRRAAADREVTLLTPVPAPALVARRVGTPAAVRADDGVAPPRVGGHVTDAEGPATAPRAGGPAHPLLATWGAAVVEDAAVLAGLDAVVVGTDADAGDVDTTGAGATQLARLRADVAVDRVPTPVPPAVRAEGRGGDGSVQVHACHGLLRQLEVLRDALQHAFEDDPTLRPEEVVVVCGDLRRAAPLIGPVLGAEVAGHRIPVAVTDRSAVAPPPVPAALDAVLAVAGGRAERDEVLALLALPAVAVALGLDDEGLALLVRVADACDVRWGVDGAHRTRWGYAGDVATGTWREAADRLVLGLLLHPEEDAVVAGIAPVVDVRSQDAAAVGRVAAAVAALADLVAATAEPRPMEAWGPVLHDVVDRWLAPPRGGGREADGQAVAVAELHGAVRAIVADAAAAGAVAPLDLLEVRAAVADRLGGGGGAVAPRGGDVRVASTVPLRGVPARVVAIVDADRIVTGDVVAADDPLAAAPRVGEPDARAEARATLLDTVLAARDRLLLLLDGQDVGTGAELPLPTVVEELLDALPDVDGTAPLVVRHPRHLADPRSVGGDPGLARLTGGRPWTFLPAALRPVARGPAAGPTPLRARWRPDGSAPGDVAVVLTPADLRDALLRPARAWLRHGLGVTLPRDPSLPQRDLPVWLGRQEHGLERWQLVTEALSRLGAGADPDRWRAARAVRGGLPPGAVADALLEEVVAEATAYRDAAVEAGAEGPERLLPIDVTVGDVRIEGVVRHRGGVVADVSGSSTHPSHVVAAWLDLVLARAAVLAGAAPDEVHGAVVVRRRGKDGIDVRRLVPDDAAVEAALGTAVDLALRARSGPLALLPRTAWRVAAAGARHDDVAKDLDRDLGAVEARWVHGALDVAALTTLASGPAEAGLPGEEDDPAVPRVARALVDAVAASVRTERTEAA